MTDEHEDEGEPAEEHEAGVDHGDGEGTEGSAVDESPETPSGGWKGREASLALVAGVIALGLVVWWWSGRDERRLNELAQETCSELEGAIVLQAGGILSGALDEADDLGFTGPELGDEMRSECPGLMQAMDNIGEESERREGLRGQMEAEITRCTSDSVTGTVVNRSDVTVDVWLEIDLEDEDGVNVGSSSATVQRLRPGQEGRWEAPVFESYARCTGRVGTVSES